MSQSLNKEERGLIALFRTLTREQKDRLLSDALKASKPDDK